MKMRCWRLKTEAKVGAITIVGMALLAYMVIFLGGYSFNEKGYEINIIFDQVNGLKPGNVVRYAGMEVGKVVDIESNNGIITVHTKIRPHVKMFEESYVSIGSDGLMGERYITITPQVNAKNILAPGATIKGQAQQGMEELVSNANSAIKDFQKLINSLNEIFSNQNLKTSVIESAINIRKITENMNVMSATLAQMALENKADIKNMVNNLNEMSKSMVSAAGTVDKMLTEFDNDGQTAIQLREAVGNLHSTSIRVEKMASAIEGVVTDPETAENIKQTLKNARSVSEKADKMLTKFSNIKTAGSVELLYNKSSEDYLTNATMKISANEKDFLLMGVNDIGEENEMNFQLGKGDENFAGRVGLIDSKAGLGIDAKLFDKFTVSLDAYDPNDYKLKLKTQYQLSPNTYLISQTNNLNKSQEQETYVGFKQNF